MQDHVQMSVCVGCKLLISTHIGHVIPLIRDFKNLVLSKDKFEREGINRRLLKWWTGHADIPYMILQVAVSLDSSKKSGKQQILAAILISSTVLIPGFRKYFEELGSTAISRGWPSLQVRWLEKTYVYCPVGRKGPTHES